MEKIFPKDPLKNDLSPLFSMSELRIRHLTDDHGLAFVWGLDINFANFCFGAKFQDRKKIVATFIDELSIGTGYGKQYTPENPMSPKRVSPSITVPIDLEFLYKIYYGNTDGYLFYVRNMTDLGSNLDNRILLETYIDINIKKIQGCPQVSTYEESSFKDGERNQLDNYLFHGILPIDSNRLRDFRKDILSGK